MLRVPWQSVYPRAIYNNLDTANFGVAPAGEQLAAYLGCLNADDSGHMLSGPSIHKLYSFLHWRPWTASALRTLGPFPPLQPARTAFWRQLFLLGQDITPRECAGGVRLCGLALSSYTVAGTALISGTTAGGATPTPVTAAIPTYPKVTVVLLDDSWQKVTGAAISTVGLRGISLWGLYYYS